MSSKNGAIAFYITENVGADIIKSVHDTFWGGYSGYFLDPDSHLWEIVWNPDMLSQE